MVRRSQIYLAIALNQWRNRCARWKRNGHFETFHIDAQIVTNNGRFLYDHRRFSSPRERIHRNAPLLSRRSRLRWAGARGITGGHAPVNRINARNLYPRKNGQVKTNDSLLHACSTSRLPSIARIDGFDSWTYQERDRAIRTYTRSMSDEHVVRETTIRQRI